MVIEETYENSKFSRVKVQGNPFTLLINIVWIIQVLRALHIRPTTQMLSDILSRLVETVAEQGEDMQVSQLYGTV